MLNNVDFSDDCIWSGDIFDPQFEINNKHSKWQMFEGKGRYLAAYRAKKQGREYKILSPLVFVEKLKINGIYVTSLPLAA